MLYLCQAFKKWNTKMYYLYEYGNLWGMANKIYSEDDVKEKEWI